MANDLNRSIKIFLDSSSAQTDATKLADSISKIEKELATLDTTTMKGAAREKELNKQLQAKQRQMGIYNEKVKETSRVLDNLSGSSYKKLSQVSKEIRKDLSNMDREAVGYTKKLKLLNSVEEQALRAKQEMRTEIGRQPSLMARASDGFNKYFGMIGAGVAALTGVTLALRSFRDERDKMEDSSAGLKALTGLDDESVTGLMDTAKRLSTSITEDGVRIRQSSVEINDAFAVVGSQRPELLKNAEALESVTEDAILLSIASKDKLEPATKALTTTLNQFNLAGGESRRVVNAIAAGSQAGAGNINYISQAMEKSGTVANSMGVSVEQMIGLIETAAPKFAEASQAGNSLDKVLLKMKNNQIGYKDGVFDMNRALDELRGRFAAGESASSIFGEEHTKMIEVLVSGQGEFNKYTEAVTGTNKAIEQAVINSNTASAARDQAINKMKLAGVELVERLNPAITSGLNLTTKTVQLLPTLVGWFIEYKGVIGGCAFVWGVYAGSVRVADLWNKRANASSIALWLTLQRQNIMLKVTRVSIVALAGSKALLAGNTAKAVKAFRLFNVVINKNPFVLAATAIAAIGVALYNVATASDKAFDKTQALIEVNKRMSQDLADEKTQLSMLVDIAKDENMNKDVRLDAIKKLNKIAPEYLGNLSLENINTKAANESIEAYTKSIERNAKAKAISNKLTELEEEKNTLQIEIDQKRKEWQEASSGSIAAWWRKRGLDKAEEQMKGLNHQIGIYMGLVKKNLNDSPVTDPKCSKCGTTLVNGKCPKCDIDPVVGGSEPEKKRLALVDELLASERLLHTQNYMQGIMDKEAYNRKMEELEIEGLRKKLEIVTKGNSDYVKLNQDLVNKVLESKEYLLAREYDLYKKGNNVAGGITAQKQKENTDRVKAEIKSQLAYEKMAQRERAKLTKKEEDDLQKKAETQRQMTGIYLQTAESFGSALGEFMADSEAGSDAFLKRLVLLALDALDAILNIEIAKMTAISMAAPDSVMSWGSLGLKRSLILAGIMKAAVATTKGIVSAKMGVSNGDSKEPDKGIGYADGGYTGNGGKYEVAGPVHKGEYVIPAWQMKVPAVMNHVRVIEAIRNTRSTANPLPSGEGYAEGGFVGSGRSTSMIAAPSYDNEMIGEMVGLLRDLKRTGVHVKYGHIENAQKRVSEVRSKASKSKKA